MAELDKHVENVEEKAREATAKASPWICALARAGYTAKGVTYVLVGGLAMLAAFSHREGRTAGQSQALASLLNHSFGAVAVALIAAGLGVFSSQSMTDLFSAIYDSTDPTDLPESDAYQLRQAFVAKTPAERVAAIRKLLDLGKDGLAREGARAAAARAASLIPPSADFEADAPDLLAAMIAGGYDKAVVRWIDTIGGMDDEAADRS